MPTEELEPETLARANERLTAAGITRPDADRLVNASLEHSGEETGPPRTRAPRSDKGKQRAAKPDPGTLAPTQANRLCILLEDVIRAERGYWDAEAARNKAMIAYNSFIEELRTSK